MADVSANFNYDADFSSAISQIKALSRELTVLNSSFNSLDKQARVVRDELATTFKAAVGDIGGFTAKTVDITSSIDDFGRALDKNKLKLRDYYREARKAFNSQSNARKLAEDQVRRTKAQLVELGMDSNGRRKGILVTPMKLDLSDVQTQLEVARKQFNIFNDLVQKGSTQLINWGKNTQWAGRQLTVGLTVPMTMFASTTIKAFNDVDKELTRFQKVYGSDLVQSVGQSTDAIRGQIQSLAVDIAKQFGIAAKETAALAADLAATGLEGQKLIDSVKQTTRLAVLGEVDRQDAMKTTLALQNAFNLSTKQLSESIDFLNAVENQTSVSLQDLTDAIPKVGPVVRALGGDVKDLSVLLVAMKEGGINAAEGANALKSGLASLINPTKQASQIAKQYGIDLEGIVKSNKGQLLPTVLEFQKSLMTLDELGKAKIIEQLFGKYQFARISALFDNLNAAGSQTRQVIELMGASSKDLANIANQEIKTLTESASMRFQRAMEGIKASLLPVGEAIAKSVLPFLEKLSGALDRVINFFSNLPEPIKNFLKLTTGLTAIAGPLIMITGVLGNFLGYIVKGAMAFVNLGRRMACLPTEKFELLGDHQIAAAKATDMLTVSIDHQRTAMMGLNKEMIMYLKALETQRAITPNLFGPPTAGKAPKRKQLGGIIRLQNGSWVPGRGEGDRVPALLEPGEFVVNKKAAKKYGGQLESMNNGTPRFQNGGILKFATRTTPGGIVPITSVHGRQYPVRGVTSSTLPAPQPVRTTRRARVQTSEDIAMLRAISAEFGIDVTGAQSAQEFYQLLEGVSKSRLSLSKNKSSTKNPVVPIREIAASQFRVGWSTKNDELSILERYGIKELGYASSHLEKSTIVLPDGTSVKMWRGSNIIPDLQAVNNAFEMNGISQHPTTTAEALSVISELRTKVASAKPGSAPERYGRAAIDVLQARLNGDFYTDFVPRLREQLSSVGKVGVTSQVWKTQAAQNGGIIRAIKGIKIRERKLPFENLPESITKKVGDIEDALAASQIQGTTGRFASMPITEVGTRTASMGGMSSLIPGVNGVYEIGGKKYIIKGHTTAESAMAEQRGTQLTRDIFGLRSPNQEFIKFKHPKTGQIVFGVRSEYDPIFANPTGTFTADEFAAQGIAAIVRRDRDLQPDNLFGNVVGDVGAAFFAERASQPRVVGGPRNSVADQALTNFLMQKGGAKKWFAETTADLARSMSASEYKKLFTSKIDAAESRVQGALNQLTDMTPQETEMYRQIITDLEEARKIDWEAIHAHHVGIYPEVKTEKPKTPAAIARAEKASAEKKLQNEVFDFLYRKSGGIITAMAGRRIKGSDRVAPPIVAPPSSGSDTLVTTFARMNPPHSGHGTVLDTANELAVGLGADFRFSLSKKQGDSSNVLNFDEKNDIFRRIFPHYAGNLDSVADFKGINGFMQMAASQGYKKVKLVIGEDRLETFKFLRPMARKYGIEAEVIGVPRPEGGMSATLVREAMASGNTDFIKNALPGHLSDSEKSNIADTLIGTHKKRQSEKEFKAQGGAWVPGTGSGDRVPALLEPGEFVVNKNAAKKYGGYLNHINFKDAPRFATGGRTSAMINAGANIASIAFIIPQFVTLNEKLTNLINTISILATVIQSISMLGGGGIGNPVKGFSNLKTKGAGLRNLGQRGINIGAKVGGARGAGIMAQGAGRLAIGALLSGPGLAALAAVGALAFAIKKYKDSLDSAKKSATQTFRASAKEAELYGIQLKNINDSIKENKELSKTLGVAGTTAMARTSEIDPEKQKQIIEANKDLIKRLGNLDQGNQQTVLAAKYSSLIQQGFDAASANEIMSVIAKQGKASGAYIGALGKVSGLTDMNPQAQAKAIQANQIAALQTYNVTSGGAQDRAGFSQGIKDLVANLQLMPAEQQFASMNNLIQTMQGFNNKQVSLALTALKDAANANYGKDSPISKILTDLEKVGGKDALALATELQTAFDQGLVGEGQLATIQVAIDKGDLEGAQKQLDALTEVRDARIQVKIEYEKQLAAAAEKSQEDLIKIQQKYQDQLDANDKAVQKENERYQELQKTRQDFIKSKQKEIDAINKGADAYIATLEKTATTEKFLDNQRKTTLGGLQALAGGDVFGFLEAQQQAAADAQQFGYDKEIQHIEDKRKAAVDAKQAEIDKTQELMDKADEAHEKALKNLEKQRDTIISTTGKAVQDTQKLADVYSGMQGNEKVSAFMSTFANDANRAKLQVAMVNYLMANPTKSIDDALKYVQGLASGGTNAGGGERAGGASAVTGTTGSTTVTAGGPRGQYATGGYISGPGTGTSDSIPARLSDGEYVVNASSVSKYGVGMLNSINEQKFATGGLVKPVKAGANNGYPYNPPKHLGTDFGNGGDEVHAAHAGKISYDEITMDPDGVHSARNKNPNRRYGDGLASYGRVLKISGNGWTTLYAHLAKAIIKDGNVTQNQTIGISGSSGNAFGGHLHFETFRDGRRVNPLSAISGNYSGDTGATTGYTGSESDNSMEAMREDLARQVAPLLGFTPAQGVGIINNGMAAIATGYPGRAMGGSLIRNKPYLVGENGPEVLLPYGTGSKISPKFSLPTTTGNDIIGFGGSGSFGDTYISIDGASQPEIVAREVIAAMNRENRRRSFDRSVG